MAQEGFRSLHHNKNFWGVLEGVQNEEEEGWNVAGLQSAEERQEDEQMTIKGKVLHQDEWNSGTYFFFLSLVLPKLIEAESSSEHRDEWETTRQGGSRALTSASGLACWVPWHTVHKKLRQTYLIYICICDYGEQLPITAGERFKKAGFFRELLGRVRVRNIGCLLMLASFKQWCQ